MKFCYLQGWHFTTSNLWNVVTPTDSIAYDLENAGNFPWPMANRLRPLHIRNLRIKHHFCFYLGSLTPVLPLLIIVLLRGERFILKQKTVAKFFSPKCVTKRCRVEIFFLVFLGKKKRVNTHYVYSIKDVRKALASKFLYF